MISDPLPYSDLSQLAYERLKEMILSGKIKPGEKIVQEKIAETLGVSRMPLHKAFQKLEIELLVDRIPRKGIYAKKMKIREIMDAFECREGLEGIAARRAAANISREQLNKMRKLFAPFRNRTAINMKAYQRADQQFHDLIMETSQNTVLQKLNNIGEVLIRTYMHGIILPVLESLNDHLLIIAALESANAEEAERLIRNHSRKARNILERKLENQREDRE
jgi:DNA-binding GntR family transcriptional regulator